MRSMAGKRSKAGDRDGEEGCHYATPLRKTSDVSVGGFGSERE
jgi:hypothetical protein